MQDIPVFTSGHGIASLTLSQIPYKQEAYIRIQSSEAPERLLSECISFCRSAGAEHIYFCGYDNHAYPVYIELLEMATLREALPDTDALLIPVMANTIDKWIEIYNYRMKDVPTSAYMRQRDGKRLLGAGNGYFIHRNGELLGIGIASGETISAIATVVPGVGRDALLALNHALSGERVIVEVASENTAARRLYDSLGFLPVRTITTWYKFCEGVM